MSFLDNIKAIPITDYASAYCGFTLVKKGNRYVSLKEHDSVMIDVQKNCYWRNSVFQKGMKNRIGASGSIIDFAIEFNGYKEPKEAMRAIALMYGISESKTTSDIPKFEAVGSKKKNKSGELILPKAAEDSKIVYRYLINERKIDASVIRYFLAKKMLYQDADHGNCVFVSHRFGCVRSTSGTRFVCDLEGCDYNECFFFRPSEKAKTLVVAESVIDIMSIMTQFVREQKRYTNYCYLALAGTNKLESLFYHLEKEKDVERILLAFDNDNGGRKAQAAALESIKNMNFDGTVEIFTAPSGKDWNEYIQHTTVTEIK